VAVLTGFAICPYVGAEGKLFGDTASAALYGFTPDGADVTIFGVVSGGLGAVVGLGCTNCPTYGFAAGAGSVFTITGVAKFGCTITGAVAAGT
jgi:hypothetical protein